MERNLPRATEHLPLSASPLLHVVLECSRGGSVEIVELRLTAPASVRTALRAANRAPEGCAVVHQNAPVPLDEPLQDGMRLQVISTFSGG
jgi:sulfur carrier protein ThiS